MREFVVVPSSLKVLVNFNRVRELVSEFKDKDTQTDVHLSTVRRYSPCAGLLSIALAVSSESASRSLACTALPLSPPTHPRSLH
jgi:hypothetical protein